MDKLFGREISRLGFGCMRLPKANGGFDLEECRAMFDYAMENGINYVDSAWRYAGSQEVVGRFLERYPRDNYILVGKLPFFDGTLESWEQGLEAFQKELDDCRTDYMDLELIHALGNPGAIQRVDRLDIWGRMQELKQSGRIRHMGISFHSVPEDLDRLLTLHPEIEVVQLQANYYDHRTTGARPYGGSIESYQIARKHGKPVIVMEPIKGGNLANASRHPEVTELFAQADPALTASAWALRYAACLDGVVTVLSGMSSLEQMKENCRTLISDFRPLSGEEQEMLRQAADLLLQKAPIGCTGCQYCTEVPCPMDIDIPRILGAYNAAEQYMDMSDAMRQYNMATKVLHKAGPRDCIACGSCEQACPQRLPIIRHLQEALARFEGATV